MHYFKMNIGDYAKKAGRLSMLEHGAYTLLIHSCYDRERFPTLEEALEWTWARTEQEESAVRFILSRFFTLVDGVYVQKRIQEEIEKYHENAQTNKRIATEREAKRRNKSRTVNEACESVNEAPPNHKPLTTNQEPITNNQEPYKEKKEESQSEDCSIPRESSLFDTFWTAYPKKVAKEEARKAFKKIKKPSQVLEQIIAALSWQTKSEDWTKEYGKFIPNPSTYLNQGRWQDERPPDNVIHRRRKDDFGIHQKVPQRENFSEKDYGTGVMDL